MTVGVEIVDVDEDEGEAIYEVRHYDTAFEEHHRLEESQESYWYDQDFLDSCTPVDPVPKLGELWKVIFGDRHCFAIRGKSKWYIEGKSFLDKDLENKIIFVCRMVEE